MANTVVETKKAEVKQEDICQVCKAVEYDVTVLYTTPGEQVKQRLMCLSCYDDMRNEDQGMNFVEWHHRVYQEGWNLNQPVPDKLKEGYEAYCDANSLVPYYPMAPEEEKEKEVWEELKMIQDGMAARALAVKNI